MKTIRTGTMKNDVELLGTDLKLKEGQRVELHPTTNLPVTEDTMQWFASPLNGNWDCGILLNHSDVDVDFEPNDV